MWSVSNVSNMTHYSHINNYPCGRERWEVLTKLEFCSTLFFGSNVQWLFLLSWESKTMFFEMIVNFNFIFTEILARCLLLMEVIVLSTSGMACAAVCSCYTVKQFCWELEMLWLLILHLLRRRCLWVVLVLREDLYSADVQNSWGESEHCSHSFLIICEIFSWILVCVGGPCPLNPCGTDPQESWLVSPLLAPRRYYFD